MRALKQTQFNTVFEERVLTHLAVRTSLGEILVTRSQVPYTVQVDDDDNLLSNWFYAFWALQSRSRHLVNRAFKVRSSIAV